MHRAESETMTGSSKKDTDLFLITRGELYGLKEHIWIIAGNTETSSVKICMEHLKDAGLRPFTEELVWMTPEEEEKIRQAAINGVLDDFQEYFENDPPIDNGAHTFRRIMNKIAEHRQQQQEEEGGGQR